MVFDRKDMCWSENLKCFFTIICLRCCGTACGCELELELQCGQLRTNWLATLFSAGWLLAGLLQILVLDRKRIHRGGPPAHQPPPKPDSTGFKEFAAAAAAAL